MKANPHRSDTEAYLRWQRGWKDAQDFANAFGRRIEDPPDFDSPYEPEMRSWDAARTRNAARIATAMTLLCALAYALLWMHDIV